MSAAQSPRHRTGSTSRTNYAYHASPSQNTYHDQYASGAVPSSQQQPYGWVNRGLADPDEALPSEGLFRRKYGDGDGTGSAANYSSASHPADGSFSPANYSLPRSPGQPHSPFSHQPHSPYFGQHQSPDFGQHQSPYSGQPQSLPYRRLPPSPSSYSGQLASTAQRPPPYATPPTVAKTSWDVHNLGTRQSSHHSSADTYRSLPVQSSPRYGGQVGTPGAAAAALSPLPRHDQSLAHGSHPSQNSTQPRTSNSTPFTQIYPSPPWSDRGLPGFPSPSAGASPHVSAGSPRDPDTERHYRRQDSEAQTSERFVTQTNKGSRGRSRRRESPSSQVYQTTPRVATARHGSAWDSEGTRPQRQPTPTVDSTRPAKTMRRKSQRSLSIPRHRDFTDPLSSAMKTRPRRIFRARKSVTFSRPTSVYRYHRPLSHSSAGTVGEKDEVSVGKPDEVSVGENDEVTPWRQRAQGTTSVPQQTLGEIRTAPATQSSGTCGRSAEPSRFPQEAEPRRNYVAPVNNTGHGHSRGRQDHHHNQVNAQTSYNNSSRGQPRYGNQRKYEQRQTSRDSSINKGSYADYPRASQGSVNGHAASSIATNNKGKNSSYAASSKGSASSHGQSSNATRNSENHKQKRSHGNEPSGAGGSTDHIASSSQAGHNSSYHYYHNHNNNNNNHNHNNHNNNSKRYNNGRNRIYPSQPIGTTTMSVSNNALGLSLHPSPRMFVTNPDLPADARPDSHERGHSGQALRDSRDAAYSYKDYRTARSSVEDPPPASKTATETSRARRKTRRDTGPPPTGSTTQRRPRSRSWSRIFDFLSSETQEAQQSSRQPSSYQPSRQSSRQPSAHQSSQQSPQRRHRTESTRRGRPSDTTSSSAARQTGWYAPQSHARSPLRGITVQYTDRGGASMFRRALESLQLAK